MMIRAAVGMSAVMTALAQPNQSAVRLGLLCMVQSWTCRNEAAPAIRPTASTIATSRLLVARSVRVGVGVDVDVVTVGGLVMGSPGAWVDAAQRAAAGGAALAFERAFFG